MISRNSLQVVVVKTIRSGMWRSARCMYAYMYIIIMDNTFDGHLSKYLEL